MNPSSSYTKADLDWEAEQYKVTLEEFERMFWLSASESPALRSLVYSNLLSIRDIMIKHARELGIVQKGV